MTHTGIRRLRLTAACLISLSGLSLIAALWLRELSEYALLDALLGACYVIAGIGLFGRSRFSLFVGIAMPGISAALLYALLPEPDYTYWLRMAVDGLTALLCLIVLWQVRNEPSV